MFERFSRSWALLKASAAILQQDKKLLLFPLFSTLSCCLVIVSFIVPLSASGFFSGSNNTEYSSIILWPLVFLFYLSQYFIIFYFNTALVGAVMLRLDGGNPSIADGMAIARSKVGTIFGYALIAATVGMILRMIEQRAGFIGTFIVKLLGVAFTAASFMTVPLLVSRDIGPIDAVKESALLLKQTWGENVIANVGLGLVFGWIYLAFLLVSVALLLFFGLAMGLVMLTMMAVVLVLAFIVLALAQNALQGVYSAILYRYATGGNTGNDFSGQSLQNAFGSR
jgi:uncharacterized membrane protein